MPVSEKPSAQPPGRTPANSRKAFLGFSSAISGPRDLCHLSLALPQVWLWVMLRSIDAVGVSNLTFYLSEGISFLAALVLYTLAPRAFDVLLVRPKGESAFEARARPAAESIAAPVADTIVPWMVAALMSLAPTTLVLGARAFPGLGPLAVAAGAVCLAWSYLSYFRLCTGLDLHGAVRCLLLSFALAPLARLPLDLLPIALAAPLAGALPLLFVTAIRKGPQPGHAHEASPSNRPQDDVKGGMQDSSRVWPLAVELAAFGFAMGILRAEAGGVYDGTDFVLLNLVLKTAVPLALLLATERLRHNVGMGALCQVALAAVVLLMVAAVNLADVPHVEFVAFDLARYVMVILTFTALTSLARRSPRPPCTVLAAGMGAYNLALAIGLAVAGATGLTEARTSPTLMLDMVCILAICTALATSGLGRGDLSLFADGSPDVTPSQAGDEIDSRCAEAAARYALSPREFETMRLICRGRSKRYIAEQMSVSENTVRGYAKTLYAKLGVHSRQDLLTLAGIE